MVFGAAMLVLACGPKPFAQVEKVEICTQVGDYGMLVDAIEITVSNPRSIKGLKADDFDLVNNTSGAFVDAATDNTCKVASTYAYSEARKRLGATQDKVLIYSDEDLKSWGVSPMMAHFSWVPLLDDYSEGSPMQWMISQF